MKTSTGKLYPVGCSASICKVVMKVISTSSPACPIHLQYQGQVAGQLKSFIMKTEVDFSENFLMRSWPRTIQEQAKCLVSPPADVKLLQRVFLSLSPPEISEARSRSEVECSKYCQRLRIISLN